MNYNELLSPQADVQPAGELNVTFSEPDPQPEVPKKQPEIEPEKLPNEDPGIQPNTKPKKEDDDDDDDDDDDYTPYTEPEIGDDPDKEKIKVPIM